MRAPAVSFAKKLSAAMLVALLTFTLLPASALAEGGGSADVSAEGTQEVDSAQAEEAAGASSEADGPAPSASLAGAGALAASLIGKPTSFVNIDVALDGEPVIGSFTVDGLTFVVVDDSTVELVGVSEAAGTSPRRVVASSQGLSAPLALPDLGSTPVASETEVEGSVSESDASVFALPESVAYNGVEYSVTSIGAYAFYLSGVTSVELAASVVDIDDRAFRSSDVASVEVAEGDPNYSSFDGALYDAEQLSLLLIPEGKQGTVLLPKTAESAAPSVFSHCPLVTQISVEEGSAAFASENGLLYDASRTTLSRVPAGATDITIREGCTTIAAGAMEGCASLERINAPASVTSISPDVFTSVPTVSLPAVSVADDVSQPSQADETGAADSADMQIAALIALSSTDDDLPEVDPSAITVNLPESISRNAWQSIGMNIVEREASDGLASVIGELSRAATSAAAYYTITVDPNGHALEYYAYESNVLVGSGPISSPYAHDWGTRFHTGTGYFDILFAESGSYINFHSGTQGWHLDGFSRYPGGPRFEEGFVGYESLTAYANWLPNPYTIAFESRGGSAVSSVAATYDANVTLPTPTRQGYAFKGWDTKADGTGSRYQAGVTLTKPNLATSGTVTLYAQWEPAISADIPLEVTAQVDLLGIEEQQEAAGYIVSRCGEPLGVAAIELSPLSGASELFGTGNVADVSLEVLAAGSTSPDARFALDASASQAPATPAAFRMASYGSRVPISYRFDIPDELLPSLVETTKPVCSVAYTVKLA